MILKYLSVHFRSINMAKSRRPADGGPYQIVNASFVEFSGKYSNSAVHQLIAPDGAEILLVLTIWSSSSAPAIMLSYESIEWNCRKTLQCNQFREILLSTSIDATPH